MSLVSVQDNYVYTRLTGTQAQYMHYLRSGKQIEIMAYASYGNVKIIFVRNQEGEDLHKQSILGMYKRNIISFNLTNL